MDNLEIIAGAVEKLEAVLERIATAQESLLAIAADARIERMKMADEMTKRLKAGFAQEK